MVNENERKVVTLSLNSPAEFHYDDESRQTAGTRWPFWIRDFGVYLDGSGITDDGQKKAVLLHVIGKSARDIYYTLAKEGDGFEAVKKVFSEKKFDHTIFCLIIFM